MKIQYYSHFFKLDAGVASVRADYFVKSLRNAGHEVLVISPKPSYPLGKIFDGFKGKIVVKNETENITYLPIWFVGSHSLIGRLLSYISYFKFSLIYILFNSFKPDVVISSSPPIFTSLVALIYSKIKKAKFIFDIHDVWPDIGVELGILTNEYYIKGLSKIEKYLLKNSHKIIVTANGDKQNILSKIDKSEKCEIIFNGADTEIVRPIDGEESVESAKSENILLLNNDTELLDDSILELIKFVKNSTQPTIGAAKIRNIDFSFQPSAYKFPSLSRFIFSNLFFEIVFKNVSQFNKYYLKIEEEYVPQVVNSVFGHL